jgi:hypothetical protein
MKENPFPKVPFVIEEKGQKVFNLLSDLTSSYFSN